MNLYLKYLSIQFRSQLQYRASFWLLTLGQFFIPFSVFAGLYLLFDRFGQLQSWSFFEVALIFGVIHMAFSVSECFARGFDAFSSLIVRGDFDRLLVRPRSMALQVLGSQFEFTRFGRMLQSAVVLAWAIANLPIDWSFAKAVTLLLMIACGVLIFTGIYMLFATMCFWTVQGLEVANVFTDGGREMAQYPLNIYGRWVKMFFTFVIPFGCVNYLPMLYILGRTSGPSIGYMAMPLAGALFMLPCLLIWRIGVRHYRSVGS
ncbi:ABC-2 family transporter protein [Cohnella lubricantis]|uniref:ABC-2 family transporter protein n=1 Tax=Cohnella lubricantis TaxID=2163172 RepID=A0A841TIX0_9BACL|nr:ABC-2 family transporter protein [Cohnella lubricantis]MBB6678441.1 ABC-2 family transporter protein [Cohnella lubricantis]MBP2116821.1 ABC-2 type transport system permease protein [Cohnella lubricantis]